MNTGKRTLYWWTRALIAVAAALPLLTFLYPLWHYAFDAPQYPEGLAMEIWVHKLAGRVDLINGLNHYVGFMYLDPADFWELKVLPALVIITVVAGLVAAAIGTVKAVRWWLVWYGLFAVFGMVDFYRWLYKFGNTVDPMAAITMEGYTPPMLGTSQFMNFYITALPGWGAYALAGGMVLGVIALILGVWRLRTTSRAAVAKTAVALAIAAVLLSACSTPKPATLVVGGDGCAFCGMVVSDPRFAAQVVTKTGKTYMFDAIECFVGFLAEDGVPADQIHSTWVANFDDPGQWLKAEEAYYLQSSQLHSPMGVNLMAFKTQAALEGLKAEVGGFQRRYAELAGLVIDSGLIDRVSANHAHQDPLAHDTMAPDMQQDMQAPAATDEPSDPAATQEP